MSNLIGYVYSRNIIKKTLNLEKNLDNVTFKLEINNEDFLIIINDFLKESLSESGLKKHQSEFLPS